MEIRKPAIAHGKQRFTIEGYLEKERAAEQKHEYLNSEIFSRAEQAQHKRINFLISAHLLFNE